MRLISLKFIKSVIKRNRVIFVNFQSLVILQAMNYLVPLISLPYLVRTLGISVFGMLVFAQAFVSYFISLTNYGFFISGPRLIATNGKSVRSRNEAATSIFVCKFLILLFSSLCVLVIVNSFEVFFAYRSLIFVTSLLLFNEALSPIWFFQGVEDMKSITIFSVLGRLISLALLFSLVHSEDDLLKAAFLQVVGGSIAAVSGVILMVLKYHYRFRFLGTEAIWTTFKQGFNIFFSQLPSTLLTNLNVTVLGLFSQPGVTGAYALGERVVRLAIATVTPVSSAIFPRLARSFESSIDETKKRLRLILFGGSLLFAALGVMLFFLSTFIVEIMSSEGSETAVLVIKCLCLLPLFIFVNNVYGMQFMVNVGRDREFRNIMIFVGCLFPPLSYLLIVHYSVLGATLALFLAEFILVALMVVVGEFRGTVRGLIRSA